MSKRKTSRGKSAVAQEYRKPQADIYTLLLVIALLMLIIATTMLWRTMKDYDYIFKGGPNPTWHLPAPALDPQRGIA
jgi:hypothetical protein